jgi:hypothetical protein
MKKPSPQLLARTIATSLDLMKHQPLWLRGAITGAVWASILYGFSSTFFAPQFQYTLNDTLVAVAASGIGGVCAVLLTTIFSPSTS